MKRINFEQTVVLLKSYLIILEVCRGNRKYYSTDDFYLLFLSLYEELWEITITLYMITFK